MVFKKLPRIWEPWVKLPSVKLPRVNYLCKCSIHGYIIQNKKKTWYCDQLPIITLPRVVIPKLELMQEKSFNLRKFRVKLVNLPRENTVLTQSQIDLFWNALQKITYSMIMQGYIILKETYITGISSIGFPMVSLREDKYVTQRK